MSFNIRNVEEKDIPQINGIYNHAISLGYATAHMEPLGLDFHYQWFSKHLKEKNPIIVMCDGEKVLGWNSLSYYRSGRKGLSSVRETSYYVHKDHWGKGIASDLMKKMIERAQLLEISTLVTFIMDANVTSVNLMEKFGFSLWGRLPGVLLMPEGTYDHLIFGKKI